MEHLAPKARLPMYIVDKHNIKPALGIFNSIKGARFLCEWESQKYDLVEYAYENWHLRASDKRLLVAALHGMPEINPCEYCICARCRKYCINPKLLAANTR